MLSVLSWFAVSRPRRAEGMIDKGYRRTRWSLKGPPATVSRKRSAESAWRNPGYAAEVRREMALAREARGAGGIVDRPIRVPKKIARPLDPSFHHVTVGRPSGRNSECLAEVMQLDDRGQLDEP